MDAGESWKKEKAEESLMFSPIRITALNDFIFCPRSLYFHGVYEELEANQYKATPQRKGTLKHSASDEGRYSSRKRYKQGMAIASEEYGLVGKVDIYDTQTGTLIERKTKIRAIYPGYRMQVVGQMVCLKEMGFPVGQVVLHSLEDNKKYLLEIGEEDFEKFLALLDAIRSFDVFKSFPIENIAKCNGCIYRTLCRADTARVQNETGGAKEA